MAVGSDAVVARVASGGDLPPVSATSVFDRALELRRLAALCSSGQFSAMAARIEQNRHMCDGQQVIARWFSESLTSPVDEGTFVMQTG